MNNSLTFKVRLVPVTLLTKFSKAYLIGVSKLDETKIYFTEAYTEIDLQNFNYFEMILTSNSPELIKSGELVYHEGTMKFVTGRKDDKVNGKSLSSIDVKDCELVVARSIPYKHPKLSLEVVSILKELNLDSIELNTFDENPLTDIMTSENGIIIIESLTNGLELHEQYTQKKTLEHGIESKEVEIPEVEGELVNLDKSLSKEELPE